MRKPMWTFPRAAAWPIAAAVGAAMVVAACGGSGPDTKPPTATLNVTGSLLGKNTPVVVRFSESMNPASLRLGGSLTQEGSGSWSRTHAHNDTYTLSPPATGWTLGDRNLTVDGADVAGNALATVSANYAVKLVFENFQAAEVVIGQADFKGTTENQGGTTAANTLEIPAGNPAVAPDGKLFIGDNGNSRVLAYNAIPMVNNANADFVLGQPNLTSRAYSIAFGTHPGPLQVSIGSGKMVVADSSGGNRAIVYDSIPVNGSALQSVVVGQPNFTSTAAACTQAGVDDPGGATITPDGKLIVSDRWNSRVLIWNSVPTTNGQPADLVLGQADFTHCAPNDTNNDGTGDGTPTDKTLNLPSALWSDGKRLVVNDHGNNRVLIWNQFPTSSTQPADVVLGQANFALKAKNDDDHDGTPGAKPTARTLAGLANGVASNGVQLAVSDYDNNRVLIWNSWPTANFQPADVVLGQSRFDLNTGNDDDQDGNQDSAGSARVLHKPGGLLFHDDKLLVVDFRNSRVLVFRSK